MGQLNLSSFKPNANKTCSMLKSIAAFVGGLG